MRASLRPWLAVASVAGVLMADIGQELAHAEEPVEGAVRPTGGFGRAVVPPKDELLDEEPPKVYVLEKITPQSLRTKRLLLEPIKIDFPNETPLEDVIQYIKTATANQGSKGLSIYVDPVGLQEAEKTLTSPLQLQMDGIPLATTLRLMLSQLGLTYEIRDDGLLVITSDSDDETTPRTAREWMNEEVESLGEAIQSLRDGLRQVRPAIKTPPPTGAGTRKTLVQGAHQEEPVVPPAEIAPAVSVVVRRPLSAAAAKAWLKLGKEITLKAKEMSLEDALKIIRDTTKTDGETLQLYVDPVGLQVAEKTMNSPVTIDLEGIPASSALELLLKQQGMTYSVHHDGLVVITSDVDDLLNPELGDLTTLNALAALRREVSVLRRELSLLRRHSVAPSPPAVTPAASRKER